jgi:hypothetical protein
MLPEAILFGCICAFIVKWTYPIDPLTNSFPTLSSVIFYLLALIWPILLFVATELAMTTYFLRSILRGALFTTAFNTTLGLITLDTDFEDSAALFAGNHQNWLFLALSFVAIPALFAALYTPSYILVALIRGKDREHSGWYCIKCGYDTTHIPNEAALIRCPECGTHTGHDRRHCNSYAKLTRSPLAQTIRKATWFLIAATAAYSLFETIDFHNRTREIRGILSLAPKAELYPSGILKDCTLAFQTPINSEPLRSHFNVSDWFVFVMSSDTIYLEPYALQNGYINSGLPTVLFQANSLEEFDRFLRCDSEVEQAIIQTLLDRNWTMTTAGFHLLNGSEEIIDLADLLKPTP